MPLGLPLPPADEHAISASMPTWQSVVGYEEGEEDVHHKLTLGYPRFVYNPQTQELFDHVEERFASRDEVAVVFPSHAAALRCQEFVERTLAGLGVAQEVGVEPGGSAAHSRLLAIGPAEALGADLTAVAVGAEHAALLKAYWQHTGEIISSRTAGYTLRLLEERAWRAREGAPAAPASAVRVTAFARTSCPSYPMMSTPARGT
jgi:cystathionine gamma-synthase